MKRVAKKKVEFTPIKSMTFDEMITETLKKGLEDSEYSQRTGLCANCKKNNVKKGSVICAECHEQTEKILKELKGSPGLMMIKVGFPK